MQQPGPEQQPAAPKRFTRRSASLASTATAAEGASSRQLWGSTPLTGAAAATTAAAPVPPAAPITPAGGTAAAVGPQSASTSSDDFVPSKPRRRASASRCPAPKPPPAAAAADPTSTAAGQGPAAAPDAAQEEDEVVDLAADGSGSSGLAPAAASKRRRSVSFTLPPVAPDEAAPSARKKRRAATTTTGTAAAAPSGSSPADAIPISSCSSSEGDSEEDLPLAAAAAGRRQQPRKNGRSRSSQGAPEAPAAEGEAPLPAAGARRGRGRGRGAAAAGAGRGRGRGRGGRQNADQQQEGEAAADGAVADDSSAAAAGDVSDGTGNVWGPYGEVQEDEDVDLDAMYGYGEMAEPPPELLMPLLPFQKQYLAWALKQEQGNLRGGILADEMGMGKTIQAISLIVSHRQDDQVSATMVSPNSPAVGIKPAPASSSKPAGAAGPAQGGAGSSGTGAASGKSSGTAVAAVTAAGGAGVGAAANNVPLSSQPSGADTVTALGSTAGDSIAAAAGGASGADRGLPAAAPTVGLLPLPTAASSALPSPEACKEVADGAAAAAPATPAAGSSSQQQQGAAHGHHGCCHHGAAAAEPAATAAAAAAAAAAGAAGGAGAKGRKGKPRAVKFGVGTDASAHEALEARNADDAAGYCKTTLVICPVVAVIQWRQELARYTAPGALKVVTYHGSRRGGLSAADLEEADVVLTTYSTIESDFRRTMMPAKVQCCYCSKRFYPERLKVHLRFFCGPHAEKSAALAKQHKKNPRGAAGGGGDDGGEEEDDSDDCGAPSKTPASSKSKAKAAAAGAPSSSKGRGRAAAASSSKGVARSRSSSKQQQDVDDSDVESLSDDSSDVESDADSEADLPQAPASLKRRKTSTGGAAAAGSSKGSGKGGRGSRQVTPSARSSSKGGVKGKKSPPAGQDDDYAPSSSSSLEELSSSSEDDASDLEQEVSLPASGKKQPSSTSGKGGAKKRGRENGSSSSKGGKGSGRRGPKLSYFKMVKMMQEGQDAQDEAEKDAERMIAAAQAAGKGGKGKGGAAAGVEEGSLLHKVRWRRIILDEAHCIKDRRCNTAKAVFALTSKYKWALSGTPLQNRVAELYSLIRFLRLFPYAYYFCTKCPCSSLDYSFSLSARSCDHCDHPPMAHFCWWNRHVANPIKFQGFTGKGRSAMLLLKNTIMPRILMRRTKVQCADDLALPPRTLVLRKDRFDASEADFYEALYTQSRASFGAYVTAGTLLNNYAHIFDLLIRLRQAVDHPYLVVYSATSNPTGPTADLLPGAHPNDDLYHTAPDPTAGGPTAAEAAAGYGRGGSSPAGGRRGAAAAGGLLVQGEDGCCGLCHDPVEDSVVAGCGHAFCRTCVAEYIESLQRATCPRCSKPLTINLSVPAAAAAAAAPAAASGPSGPAASSKRRSILSRISASTFQSSTKIEALREELERMREADPGAKAIVFSQFTSMLELIQYRLEQVGVACVRLDGSMSLEQRDTVIKTFTNDPKVVVFLMSLKAGGVALNLTAASHVMLMDPWWNPAVEQQAQDRIHRLGQYKPIQVTRFVIAGSIEERILKLQEKKQAVFEGTVGRDTAALARLTEDDLRFLFS